VFPSLSLSSRRKRICAGEFLIQPHDLFVAGQIFDRLLQFFAAEIAVSVYF